MIQKEEILEFLKIIEILELLHVRNFGNITWNGFKPSENSSKTVFKTLFKKMHQDASGIKASSQHLPPTYSSYQNNRIKLNTYTYYENMLSKAVAGAGGERTWARANEKGRCC